MSIWGGNAASASSQATDPVSSVSVDVNASVARSDLDVIQGNVDQIATSLGSPTDPASSSGNVYERLNYLDQRLDTNVGNDLSDVNTILDVSGSSILIAATSTNRYANAFDGDDRNNIPAGTVNNSIHNTNPVTIREAFQDLDHATTNARLAMFGEATSADTVSVVTGGTKYNVGDVHTGANGLKIKVTQTTGDGVISGAVVVNSDSGFSVNDEVTLSNNVGGTAAVLTIDSISGARRTTDSLGSMSCAIIQDNSNVKTALRQLDTEASSARSDIGQLQNLAGFENNGDVVAALNELQTELGDVSKIDSTNTNDHNTSDAVGYANTLNARIGTLSDLTNYSEPESIDTIVNSINDVIANVGDVTSLTNYDAQNTKTVTASINDVISELGTGTLDTTATDVVAAVNELHAEINTNTAKIDASNNLLTTATTLTGAINEVHGDAETNATNINSNTSKIGNEAFHNEFTASTLVAAVNENLVSISDVKTSYIGGLASLQTDAQGSIVAAINEVNTHADDNTTNMGGLASLQTTDQDSIVDAINEVNSNVGTIANLQTLSSSNIVAATNEVRGQLNFDGTSATTMYLVLSETTDAANNGYDAGRTIVGKDIHFKVIGVPPGTTVEWVAPNTTPGNGTASTYPESLSACETAGLKYKTDEVIADTNAATKYSISSATADDSGVYQVIATKNNYVVGVSNKLSISVTAEPNVTFETETNLDHETTKTRASSALSGTDDAYNTMKDGYGTHHPFDDDGVPVAIEMTAAGTGYTSPIVTMNGFSVEPTVDTTVDSGAVSIKMLSRGAGLNPVSVTIAAPQQGGTQATGIVEMKGNSVDKIIMTNFGGGYSQAPSVTFSGMEDDATATAILGNSSGGILNDQVVGVTINDGGKLVTLTIQRAPVTVTIAPPADGTGSAATANVTMDGNEVDSVTITDHGSGYAENEVPTVTFSNMETDPTVSVTMNVGEVASITVTDGGARFTAAPSDATAEFVFGADSLNVWTSEHLFSNSAPLRSLGPGNMKCEWISYTADTAFACIGYEVCWLFNNYENHNFPQNAPQSIALYGSTDAGTPFEVSSAAVTDTKFSTTGSWTLLDYQPHFAGRVRYYFTNTTSYKHYVLAVTRSVVNYKRNALSKVVISSFKLFA